MNDPTIFESIAVMFGIIGVLILFVGAVIAVGSLIGSVAVVYIKCCAVLAGRVELAVEERVGEAIGDLVFGVVFCAVLAVGCFVAAGIVSVVGWVL